VIDGLKVTSWFGERDRTHGRFVSDALLDAFGEEQVASSVLVRATGGFGLAHHLRGDQTLTLSEDPSVVATAVDTVPRIERLLDRVTAIQPRGMVTVERLALVDGGPPEALPGSLREETRLTIRLGRHDRVGRGPAYVAACALLHDAGVAGASVVLGVDGTRAGRRERARFWSGNPDVPAEIVAVGASERIAGVVPELVELLDRPMLTVERVRVCKRDGVLLGRPDPLPRTDASGLGLWQRLTVYTSESQLYGGEPVHRAIVRRLRLGPARGATAVRGVWGYHGDHQPHGDRLLQLGRRVPVITTVVDSPDRIGAAFDVIDELTPVRGLVTSEMVPAMQYVGPARGGLRLASYDY
jgi:PII-like signaling protein